MQPPTLMWRAMVYYRGRKRRARVVRDNAVNVGRYERTSHLGGAPLQAMVDAAEAALASDAAEILNARLVLIPVTIETDGTLMIESYRSDSKSETIELKGPG